MMKHRRMFTWPLIVLLVVISGSFEPTIAFGQASTPCEDIDTREKASVVEYQRDLVVLYQRDCLGGESDAWPFAVTVTNLPSLEELRKDPDPEEFDRVMSTTLKSVKALLEHKINQATAEIDAKGDLSSLTASEQKQLIDEKRYGILASLKPLKTPISTALNGLLSNAPNPPDVTVPWEARYWTWVPSTGNFGVLTIELYDDFLLPACTDVQNPACQKAYVSAKEVLRYSTVVERILTDWVVRPKIKKTYDHVVLLDKQWDHYFNDARSQFPWELALNGYLYDKFDRKADGEILQAPPRHQLIVMHPSVALEYIDQAPDGNQLRESWILEVAGYNWWNWENRDNNTALGLSLITSYSDRPGTGDVGFGLMAHYNHTFSIGGTIREGGDPGVFVSFDVGRFLLKAPEKSKEAFKFLQ